MASPLSVYLSTQGVPLGPGALFRILSAEVQMTELGQFSAHALTLPLADRRVAQSIPPFTLVEFVQDAVGTIGYGYILNPKKQLTDNENGTLTLTLPNITVEGQWSTTRRGWVAQNTLGVIANRLATLIGVPGTKGKTTWTCNPVGDVSATVLARADNVPPLQGFLQLAKDFYLYARQGINPDGSPARALEIGTFGAPPTVTLLWPNGGDAASLAQNPNIRLITALDHNPQDAEQLVNWVTPLGGGDSGSQVTLQRLWQMLNDPTYVNYGKQVQFFPEYDPNYPICDPVQVVYGGATGNPLAVTLDGHHDYDVWDRTSVGQWDLKWGNYTDSGKTYQGNAIADQEKVARALYIGAVATLKRRSQPRHLIHCTAEGRGRPPRAGDQVAVDYQRATRDEDGAIVLDDIVSGAPVMGGVNPNTVPPLSVLGIRRKFQGEQLPLDDYTLSDNLRWDMTDAQGIAQMAQQLAAVQINSGTTTAPFGVGPLATDMDALHPLDMYLPMPKTLFRVQNMSLRVDFQPYRQTATTAVNTPGTPIPIIIPSSQVTIAVDHAGGAVPTDPLTGKPIAAFDPTTQTRLPGANGFLNPTDANHTIAPLTGAMTYAPNIGFMTGTAGAVLSLPFLTMGNVNRGIGAASAVMFSPTGFFNPQTGALSAGVYASSATPGTPNVISIGQVILSGGNGSAAQTANATGGTGGTTPTNPTTGTVDTSHPHPVPISNKVVASTVLYGVIQQQNLTAPLPAHTHPLDQRIQEGPLPPSITVLLNGQLLSSNVVTLTSGTANSDGTFASSFVVDNIPEAFFLNVAGTSIHLQLTSSTTAGNPYGVGRVQAQVYGMIEYGTLTSITKAA